MSMHPETSAKYKAFFAAAKLLRASLRLLGPHAGAVAAARLAELLSPEYAARTRHGTLRFFCPGHVPLWQAEHLLSKEPETIDWLEQLPRGTVLWDVGANVGSYSIYAAMLGIQVVAFEPSAANYYLLNRNIALNQFEDRIAAYCLALAERSGLNTFYLSSTEIGEALHSFGNPTDWRAQSFVPATRQSVLGHSIDSLVATLALPFPSAIKIDVDGNEDQIIKGAARSLADPRLRSLLIEINTERTAYRDSIVAMLAAHGLRLRDVRRSRLFDNSVYASAYNHIFVRE